jgi:hypothetical protein
MTSPIDRHAGSAGVVCGDTRLRTHGDESITLADVVERLHRSSNPRVQAVDAGGATTSVEIHYARRLGDDIAITELVTDRAGLLHASSTQLVLDAAGAWKSLGELRVGDELAVVSRLVDGAAIGSCRVTAVGHAPLRSVYEFAIPALHNAVSADGLVIHD